MRILDLISHFSYLLAHHSLSLLYTHPQIVYQSSNTRILEYNHFKLLDSGFIFFTLFTELRDDIGVCCLLSNHWLQKGSDQLTHPGLKVQPLNLLRLD